MPTQDGPLGIEEHKVWPMPLRPGQPARLAVKLQGPADAIELKVYTKALICVGRLTLGPGSGGWNQLILPSDWTATLSPGLYYYEVTALRGDARVQAAKPGKIMVLR